MAAAAAASAPSAPTSCLDPAAVMKTRNESWDVLDLMGAYKKPTGDAPAGMGRIRLPRHQREWSWTGAKGLKKMRCLIHSILHGFPIPSIILNEVDGGILEVYDGRHRIETLVRFGKDEFTYRTPAGREIKFSDLCEADRIRFQMRGLPVILTRGATPLQLAEVFIRLNSGKALTQADYCWACRDTPLIQGTQAVLAENRERFRELLGGTNIADRKTLPHWAGLFAGTMTNNAGNMTTSFERLQAHLDVAFDRARAQTVMDALFVLYTRANAENAIDAKALKEYARLGFINAFFLADWMERGEEVYDEWLPVIDHIRRTGKKTLVKVSGAQNLTWVKINTIRERVLEWLTTGEIPVDEGAHEEDSDASDD